jgi:hypothetical protein
MIKAQSEEENLEIFDDSFWDTDFDTSFKMEHPVVEVVYGITQPKIHKDGFNSDFSQVSSVNGRFGYTDIESNLFESNVFEYSLTCVSLGYSSSKLNFSEDDNISNIGINRWQFGVGSMKGYGHKFTEKTNLLFYSASNINWSGIDYDEKAQIPTDQKLIDRFADGIRFGESFEGGIKFQVYEPIAITASYERQIVYPRLLFWKWAGSGLLFGIGEGIISHFSEKIIKASPTFGPFFNFVLLNAYKYGTYELRKKRMNWPFVTEAPLMYEGFNVGLSFTF